MMAAWLAETCVCKLHPCTGTEALYRPYGLYGGRGIALLFHDHGTRRTARYRRERPGTNCTGGWVGWPKHVGVYCTHKPVLFYTCAHVGAIILCTLD